MNKNLALLITLSSFTATAMAEEACKPAQEVNYKNCDNQMGWYIGGALGFAETDISKSRIDQYFSDNQLDVNNVSIDNDDMGFSGFFGYQFNSNLALEAGYLDLGERTVRFSGQAADIAAYYDSAEHIYPQSADGLLLALVGSWPFAEDWKLSAKIGYYDWEGDYITFDAQGNQGDDSISDNDILLGGELNYRLSEQAQLFAAYQRVKLNRDTNDMWSLGLRYYFNDENQPRKAKPAPVVAEHKPAPVVARVDSDMDGVYDNDDQCANSDKAYLVDAKGCTLKSEQWVDFSLVINYANDSAEIGSQYNDKIVDLADFIKRYEVKTLTVYGHTSATGSERYNMKLSKQRANSVAKKLTSEYGIDADIINPVGKGETELKVEGNSEHAHQQNRRIELSIKERLLVPVKR